MANNINTWNELAVYLQAIRRRLHLLQEVPPKTMNEHLYSVSFNWWQGENDTS